jgi:hypothetical protein
MRHFVRKLLHNQRQGIEEYIRGDPHYSGKFTRLVMLVKSLTFHKKCLEDNFDPYVHDILKEIMNIAKSMLEELPPDSTDVKFITYANLLQVLSFDVHPNSRNDPNI